jgi:plastocyanin
MWQIGIMGLAKRLFAAQLLAFALISWGTPPASAADAEVAIVQPGEQESWRYDPPTLTVSAGTTVTWINGGNTTVTVTSPDLLFDSGDIPPGGRFRMTFEAPGTFRYFCVPYPNMKGSIIVTRESGASR